MAKEIDKTTRLTQKEIDFLPYKIILTAIIAPYFLIWKAIRRIRYGKGKTSSK